MKKLLLLLCVLAAGCATKTVRQADLDAWVGMPVSALDLQSFFLTLPLKKTITDDGVEVRVYSNMFSNDSCTGGAGVVGKGAALGWSNCVTSTAGCHNIFYIKDRRVIEYKPQGNCYTDEVVLPDRRFKPVL